MNHHRRSSLLILSALAAAQACNASPLPVGAERDAEAGAVEAEASVGDVEAPEAATFDSPGTPDGPGPFDAQGDGPDTAPADGGGVCCPLTVAAGCSPPRGYWGGWAPVASACMMYGPVFDGPPFVIVTDAHGCPLLQDSMLPACGMFLDSGSNDGGTG